MLKKIKDGELSERAKVLFVLAIVFIPFMIYISGAFARFLEMGISALLDGEVAECFKWGILHPKGRQTALVISFMAASVFWILHKRGHALNAVEAVDERGVNYSKDKTYGSASWMDEQGAKKTFEVKPIAQCNGTILGQLTENGEKCVCLPENTPSNRNILILGAPGTGKSFCFVKSAVLQAAKRGESMVVTDTKGELFSELNGLLKEMGYNVKLFNLALPKRSDAWNVVSEIYDPATGNIDDLRVTEFCDALMRNTGGDSGDSFWEGGESNLLRAILLYCAWHREDILFNEIQAEGLSVIKANQNAFSSDEIEEFSEILNTSVVEDVVTMNERKELLYKILERAYSADYAEERMKNIELDAPPCNLASIYHMIVNNDMTELESKFKVVPLSHPASIAWNTFQKGSDNSKPGMIQGLGQRLQLFQVRDVRRIASNDDIVLTDIGGEKTALFCVISDKSAAMKCLSSLFFTFLFKDNADIYDTTGGKGRLPINIIADEFINLGVIPGFGRTIATVRSRKINISIILQDIGQLTTNYGSEDKTIVSCCDTILFLGCNDPDTAAFISDLSGTASIRVMSVKDDRSNVIGYRELNQGYSISDGEGKRNLLNPDEVRRLGRNEVIIYHNGNNILKAKRCGYIEHPYYKKGFPKSIPMAEYELSKIKYKNTEFHDAFIQGDLDAMNRKNIDIAQNKTGARAPRDLDAQNGKLNNTKTKYSDAASTEDDFGIGCNID